MPALDDYFCSYLLINAKLMSECFRLIKQNIIYVGANSLGNRFYHSSPPMLLMYQFK